MVPSQTLIDLHPINCHEGILALNKLIQEYTNAATGNQTGAHQGPLQSERLVKDQKRTSPVWSLTPTLLHLSDNSVQVWEFSHKKRGEKMSDLIHFQITLGLFM